MAHFSTNPLVISSLGPHPLLSSRKQARPVYPLQNLITYLDYKNFVFSIPVQHWTLKHQSTNFIHAQYK